MSYNTHKMSPKSVNSFPKTPLPNPSISSNRSKFYFTTLVGICFIFMVCMKHSSLSRNISLRRENDNILSENNLEDHSSVDVMKPIKSDRAQVKFLRSRGSHFDITNSNAINRKLWYNDLIPYHFWTAGRAAEYDWGWGTAPGNTFVVFKSWKDRYLSIDTWTGDFVTANRVGNGPWEKFEVDFLENNKIALKGWNGKYMSCFRGNEVQINRDEIGPWEEFEVYTTDTKNFGLAERDDYIALKSVAFNTWVVVKDNGYVYCNSDSPGPWEKFTGWTSSISWNVDSVEFDLSDGTIQAQTPIILGQIINDNRKGHTERIMKNNFTKVINQIEQYGNAMDIGISVGTTFKTGVPFITDGKISRQISDPYGHTWGFETYTETMYKDEIQCISPPGIKMVCSYMANKAYINVPYTMYLSKPGGYTKTVSGTWFGVTTYDDHVITEEIERKSEEIIIVTLYNIEVSLKSADENNINEIEREMTQVIGYLEVMDMSTETNSIRKLCIDVQKKFNLKKEEIFS